MPIPLFDTALQTSGEVRLVGSLPPEVQTGADGEALGQGPVLDTRLRLGLQYKQESWSAAIEGDAFDGQALGDAWDLPADDRDRDTVGLGSLDRYDLRRFSVAGRLGPVGLEGGLVTSQWGLGLVANDGAHDPVFGRADFGDRVVRLRLGTQPWKGGTIAVFGDRVVEDDTARWADGQAAWQTGLALVQGGPDAPYTLGLYGVGRLQIEPDDGGETRAGLLDLYGRVDRSINNLQLHAGVEAAGLAGHTTRARSVGSVEGLDLRSAGAFGTVGLAGARWGADLRAGWASGDGDPDDGVSHDFSFDRDLDAGMVLFDELQGALDATAYGQITDPANTGVPPDGIDSLLTEGAVRRAAFLQPVVEVAPLGFATVRLGAMPAWATAPIAQPFETARNGGVPTNQLGQATTGRYLGTELDWALELSPPNKDEQKLAFQPALLLQGGHLLASDDLGGGTVSLWTATARGRW